MTALAGVANDDQLPVRQRRAGGHATAVSGEVRLRPGGTATLHHWLLASPSLLSSWVFSEHCARGLRRQGLEQRCRGQGLPGPDHTCWLTTIPVVPQGRREVRPGIRAEPVSSRRASTRIDDRGGWPRRHLGLQTKRDIARHLGHGQGVTDIPQQAQDPGQESARHRNPGHSARSPGERQQRRSWQPNFLAIRLTDAGPPAAVALVARWVSTFSPRLASYRSG